MVYSDVVGHARMHFSELSPPSHTHFFHHPRQPVPPYHDGWNNGEHKEHDSQEQRYHKLRKEQHHHHETKH